MVSQAFEVGASISTFSSPTTAAGAHLVWHINATTAKLWSAFQPWLLQKLDLLLYNQHNIFQGHHGGSRHRTCGRVAVRRRFSGDSPVRPGRHLPIRCRGGHCLCCCYTKLPSCGCRWNAATNKWAPTLSPPSGADGIRVHSIAPCSDMLGVSMVVGALLYNVEVRSLTRAHA